MSTTIAAHDGDGPTLSNDSPEVIALTRARQALAELDGVNP